MQGLKLNEINSGARYSVAPVRNEGVCIPLHSILDRRALWQERSCAACECALRAPAPLTRCEFPRSVHDCLASSSALESFVFPASNAWEIHT